MERITKEPIEKTVKEILGGEGGRSEEFHSLQPPEATPTTSQQINDNRKRAFSKEKL